MRLSAWLTCFAIVLLFACKKESNRSVDINALTPFKEWLHKNGSIFKNESITLSFENGSNHTGTLNWGSVIPIKKRGYDVVIVPFTFQSSKSKGKKLMYEKEAGELPSMYHLMIRRYDNGKMEGRFRSTGYEKNEEMILASLYDMKGNLYSTANFFKDGRYQKLKVDYSTPARARVGSECTLDASTVQRKVSCTGGMENTTCKFYKLTTYTYKCQAPSMGDGGEEEREFEIVDGSGSNDPIIWDEFVDEQVYENQKIIDSLQGYPCAQEVLAQLPELNEDVKSFMTNVFGGFQDDINLKFRADISLTKDSADGYTKFPGGSQSFYNQVIHMNPWVMNNSPKEYILVTMYHEAIHSVVDYWWNQYLMNPGDSNIFKAKFPIFWNHRRILNDPAEIAQHNEMAQNYITRMKNVIQSFNPNVSDSIAIALAWGGLHKTTAWKNKSDTIQINLINYNSRDTSLGVYSTYNLKKCN